MLALRTHLPGAPQYPGTSDGGTYQISAEHHLFVGYSKLRAEQLATWLRWRYPEQQEIVVRPGPLAIEQGSRALECRQLEESSPMSDRPSKEVSVTRVVPRPVIQRPAPQAAPNQDSQQALDLLKQIAKREQPVVVQVPAQPVVVQVPVPTESEASLYWGIFIAILLSFLILTFIFVTVTIFNARQSPAPIIVPPAPAPMSSCVVFCR